MGILLLIFYEVCFWVLAALCMGILSILWALLLPVALVVAAPVILAVSAMQKKSAKQMLLLFILWWTDFLPSLPDFKNKKASNQAIERYGKPRQKIN